MIFKDIIKDIVDNIEGCWSGLMMGIDGVMVENYVKEEKTGDINTMSIEFANILKDICRSSEQLETGKVQEITIKTESMIYLIKMIDEEYFAAIILNPLGNYGKARYLLKKSILEFRKEL